MDFKGGNEVLSILGASGSGKSMILRCIAGVEKPDTGVISLDDKILFDSEKSIDLPVSKRKTGLLFQELALFPNMTVKENLEIVAKANRINELKVMELLKTYDLVNQQNQYTKQLSGGQKQRCAIARILLTSPDIILLDEPFSALDSFLRRRLEKELFAYLKNYKKTVVFVSHSREEVYRQSNKISVISNGKTLPMKEKEALFQNPNTKEVARLIGCENIFPIEDIKRFLINFPCMRLYFDANSSANIKYIGFFARDFIFTSQERVEKDGERDGSSIYFDFRMVDCEEGFSSNTYTIKPENFDIFLTVEMDKSVNLMSGGLLLLERKNILYLE